MKQGLTSKFDMRYRHEDYTVPPVPHLYQHSETYKIQLQGTDINTWPTHRHISTMMTRVIFIKRKRRQAREVTRRHYYIIFVSDFFLSILLLLAQWISYFYFPRAKTGKYYPCFSPQTPQADSILSFLSGFMCHSMECNEKNTEIPEQRENQDKDEWIICLTHKNIHWGQKGNDSHLNPSIKVLFLNRNQIHFYK